MRVLSVSIVLVLVGMVALMWLGGVRSKPAIEGPDVAQPTAHGATTQLDSTGVVDAAPRTEVADAKREAEAPSANASAPIAAGRCRIHGRVTSEDGRPVVDADVSMYSVGGKWSTKEALPLVDAGERSHEALRAKTAADGTFSFTAPVPTSDWVSLSVTPTEYLSLGDRNFGPAGGRNQPRLVEGDNDLGDIALVECGAISGMVRSADGASMAKAVVSSMSRGDQVSNALADASGRFVLGHLPPGKTTFDVKKEGWISASQNAVDVRVGRTTQVDDIVLSRASEISGIVVDQQGQPAAKVRIWGWPQSSGQGAGATTRDDGTFTVYLPQTEPYSFEINRAKEFEPWGGQRGAPEFTFEPGRKDVRIVLKRAAQLTFRVVDAVIGAPIEAFGISVDEKLAEGQWRNRFTRGLEITSRPDGVATLSASVSKHDVAVRADGYAPYEGPIVLDPGSADTATIALERGSSVRGRCIRGGSPVVKAQVGLQRESLKSDGTYYESLGALGSEIHYDVSPNLGQLRTVATDEEGRFVFDGLVHGTYALVVEHPDAAKKMIRQLAVPAHDVLDVGEVSLAKGAIVRGRILTPPGTSPVGYEVMMDNDWSRDETIDSADGSFEIRGLPAGTHVLDWNRPGENGFTFLPRSPRAIDVVLADGEVRELMIDTTASGPSTVRVRVMRAEKPAVGVKVRGELHARGDTTSRMYTNTSPTVDSEGWAQLEIEGGAHFDLVVLAPDENVLLASVPNLDAVAGSTLERTIEIRTGTLTIEVPPALSAPEAGWQIRVVLTRANQSPIFAAARAVGDGAAPKVGRAWTGSVVEFGEFPADTYEVAVAFERPGTASGDPRSRQPVPIREPYKTTITIEDGEVARIVVP